MKLLFFPSPFVLARGPSEQQATVEKCLLQSFSYPHTLTGGCQGLSMGLVSIQPQWLGQADTGK